jgi:hypothetical protein
MSIQPETAALQAHICNMDTVLYESILTLYAYEFFFSRSVGKLRTKAGHIHDAVQALS